MGWWIVELIKFLVLSLLLIALAASLLAGICLILGILHGINVLVLPFIGGILALRERLTVGTRDNKLRTDLADLSLRSG
jgi:hypothetical protein